MYGIFNNIGPKNHPNVGTYTTHGAYGLGESFGIHFFGYISIRFHRLGADGF